MTRKQLIIIAALIFSFSFSLAQSIKKEILINKWVVDSVIISGKDMQGVNKDTLEKNIKLLKESSYFDFRADSTVEIKLFEPILINQGWWTLTNQDTVLTVYSNEIPAYYGVPIGEPEIIFQIKLLQVDKDKSVFEMQSMTLVVRPVRKKNKSKK